MDPFEPIPSQTATQVARPGGGLRLERDAGDGRIARLTLSHPGRMNAIGLAMWQSLNEIASGLDRSEPAVHVVIVRGEAGHFAAGADVSEFPTLRFDTESLRRYHEQTVAPALRALRECEVPLVAQIEGACIGGGLEIAACCDLRIAASNARFGAPIARLGFPMAPDEMAILLEVLGHDTVAEMLLEARLLDADTALQRGVVHRLSPDVAVEAHATAERIAALPPDVARTNKRTLRQLRRGGLSDAERAAHFNYAGSRAHRDGVLGFLARQGGRIQP